MSAMADRDPHQPTPRVDALIARVSAAYRGESERANAEYFYAVHQELAPLARDLEREAEMLRALLVEFVRALGPRQMEMPTPLMLRMRNATRT